MSNRILNLLVILVSLFFFNQQALALTSSLSSPIDITSKTFQEDITALIGALYSNNQKNISNIQNKVEARWNTSIQSTDWDVIIAKYRNHQLVNRAEAKDPSVSESIKNAIAELENNNTNHENTKDVSWIITFLYYPHGAYSFTAAIDKSPFEMIGNRASVRLLTHETFEKQLNESAQYLIRAINPTFFGVYKFYNATTDEHEEKLRTIYTASTLYTLMKLDKHYPQYNLQSYFQKMGNFLLSMQIRGGRQEGSFYYSFSPKLKKHNNTTVVGTTSKTIFTLIKLYEYYHNEQYLNAAKRAGNWLLTRVMPDGRIITRSKFSQQTWHDSYKQSHLYSGQVLSALSRLYILTEDKQYLIGATKVADYLKNILEKQSLPVSDDYRKNTPIGTSWLMMSFMDYVNASKDEKAKDYVQKIARYLASTQILNTSDLYHKGRFSETTTPSGIGWITEVYGEYYNFCLMQNLEGCDNYLPTMLHAMRWLHQNAFTQHNFLNVKNPKNAKGGFILLFSENKVRTDSVCHGVNGLLALTAMTKQQPDPLLVIPEPSFYKVLSSLRAGTLSQEKIIK